MTFKTLVKLITGHSGRMAINALKDKAEVIKIVEWMKREINHEWAKKDEIDSSWEPMPIPLVIEILKCLPMINCRKCGAPTCMVFATYVAEGWQSPEDCPKPSETWKKALSDYMRQFHLDRLLQNAGFLHFLICNLLILLTPNFKKYSFVTACRYLILQAHYPLIYISGHY